MNAVRRLATKVALVTVASAACATAADGQWWFPPADRVSIEPFYGLRFGGEVEDRERDRVYPIDERATVGARLSAQWGHVGGLALFSRQATRVRTRAAGPVREPRLTIDQWMIGTFREYPQRWASLRPYVEGAVGVTHFSTRDADVEIPSPTRFAVAAGGGAALMVTPNVGLRLGARGYLSLVRSGTVVFCSAGCSVLFRAGGLIQGELQAALVVAF